MSPKIGPIRLEKTEPFLSIQRTFFVKRLFSFFGMITPVVQPEEVEMKLAPNMLTTTGFTSLNLGSDELRALTGHMGAFRALSNKDVVPTVKETTARNENKIDKAKLSKAQVIDMVQRTLTPEDIATLYFQTHESLHQKQHGMDASPAQKVEETLPSDERNMWAHSELSNKQLMKLLLLYQQRVTNGDVAAMAANIYGEGYANEVKAMLSQLPTAPRPINKVEETQSSEECKIDHQRDSTNPERHDKDRSNRHREWLMKLILEQLSQDDVAAKAADTYLRSIQSKRSEKHGLASPDEP